MNQYLLGYASKQESLDRFHSTGTDHNDLRLMPGRRIQNSKCWIAVEQFCRDLIGGARTFSGNIPKQFLSLILHHLP